MTALRTLIAPCRRVAVALVLAMGVVISHGGPAAAQAARFGGVSVACDSDMTCVASVPADGESPPSVLQIARGPDSRARWTLAVTTLGPLADRDRPVSLSIDNGVGVTLRPAADFAPMVRPNDFYILSQSALDRIMVRLTRGADLRFSYIDIFGAPHTDRYRLDGLAAALNEIDRRQQRVLGDRRAGPPRGLPPAPAVDEAGLVAEAGVPSRLLDFHMAGSLCEAPGSEGLSGAEAIIGALSETATLYAIPCFASAAGVSYRLYLIESGEIGGMDHLVFAGYSPRFGWIGLDTLQNVVYDPQTRRLTGESRGETGCGGRGAWVFEDYAFRMERYAIADGTVCEGVFQTVYPAG